jgi:iron(III) transport system substrate-binding protein
VNFEYPVNPAVAPGGVLASWGDFKRDDLAIERLAELAPDAQMIIDRVGW